MKIDEKELSEMLLRFSEEQLMYSKKLLLGAPDVFLIVILIEAARVLDYETVIMGLSADESLLLEYPDYDVLTRGWNPLLAHLLPLLPEVHGIPVQESTPETRGKIRTLLHAFGKSSVLRKAADMAFHGFLIGEEIEGRLSLKMTHDEGGDHFLDQLEGDKLAKAMNGDAEPLPQNNFLRLSKDEVNEIIGSLVFPFKTGHGMMVGYGADPRLDEHFYGLTVDRATKWREEAGIHPDLAAPELHGANVGVLLLLLISTYMKHIWFVGVGKKKLDNINYFMSLTIWKDPAELVKSISEFTGLSEVNIREAFEAIVVTKKDASYFANEGTPFVPLLIELSKGYWLAPISSVFRNPFEAVRMLGEHRHPKIGPALRAPREDWMIDDLAALFAGTRYRVVKAPTRLKRAKVTITDIDAAILDVTTGELAVFQLKWQDFGSNSLGKIRSRARNFVTQVDSWVEKTNAWIDEFGVEALCQNLKISIPPGAGAIKVLLFAIGKSNARFASYGYNLKSDAIAACNWKQFVRLRYEVGPSALVISEIYRRVIIEKTTNLKRRPISYDMTTGESNIRFEDMWSLSD